MKNSKIIVISALSLILVVWWFWLAVPNTQSTLSNYLWQVGLAAVSILYALLGLATAQHWSWLKSDVGKGVFFIATGVLMWGLGQAGWSYYTLVQPDIEVPTAPILDVLYFSSMPFWTYGIIQLSRATGAKYGLRGTRGKIFATSVFLIIIAFSYYFLVNVARGGMTAYLNSPNMPDTLIGQAFKVTVDFGYALGDAFNLVLAITIFGLSWKYLGGRFKKPILTILVAFCIMYVADFSFSYYDANGLYFNGHWSDLLFLVVMTLLGLALVMMDPRSLEASKPQGGGKDRIPAPMPPQKAPNAT